MHALLPGTQMHIITFIFACIELVIFFYLLIYMLARPDDKTAFLNIILIALLITYNVTGGLLPDPQLPGSVFIQEGIAYATGFITPCFFPYYVYKAFGLEKMKFHAYRGVFLFLMLPYFLFLVVYAATGSLEIAKNLLALPVLYAFWVVITLFKAIRFKYKNNFNSRESKEEAAVLILSIAPWIGLPFIDYFSLSQAMEASITNPGFLLLLSLQVSRHIKQIKKEHQGLIDSELRLKDWNINLQKEVDKKTQHLERINEQKTNTFINLAHETKTPLTLINNYLEEYILAHGNSPELSIVKRNLDKLSADIVNFFDLERFNKGFAVYNHDRVSDFTEILRDSLILFREYARNRNIKLDENIEKNIFIKADPVAISRVVNNLVENAVKFSGENSIIKISLHSSGEKIIFSVKDNGIGIPIEMHKKVFEPYYQITTRKKSIQGMGLGLPIVKKVIRDLHGEIEIESDPKKGVGTTIRILLLKCEKPGNEIPVHQRAEKYSVPLYEEIKLEEELHNVKRQTIVIAEDNISMLNYLFKKLNEKYNVYTAINGNDALQKIKSLAFLPDLIISDVMMDKLGGYGFVKILHNDPAYHHIPVIFLSAKSSRDDKLQGLKLGAIDFIQKPFVINELLQKIESILRNVQKQKQSLVATALDTLTVRENQSPKKNIQVFDQNAERYRLTTREKDIARLVSEGHSYKSIGRTLYISERTVTTHVQNIFEKLSVTNKIELINKLSA